MKKKALITLLAALTAGSFLLLSGCGTDQPDGDALSAEAETTHFTDGTIEMHSVWYNADDSALSSAAITILDRRDEVFTGTTDEAGNLASCSLPGNTTFTCEVTDSTGSTVAEGEFIFQISDEYESLTIYPVHEGNGEHVMEIPADKTDLRVAIFVTEDGELSFVNLSPYTGSEETSGEENADAAAGQTGADAGQAGTDAGQTDPAAGQTDAAAGQTGTNAAAGQTDANAGQAGTDAQNTQPQQ